MLRKVPDWLIYGFIIVLMLWNANRSDQDVVAPLPPPELGPLLPSQSPRDARVLVDVDRPQSGVGTAFAIDENGRWMTARHVVDSCDEVALKIGRGKLLPVESTIYKEADLAVLSANWKRKPLPSDLNTRRQVGETGFFFGYPQGQPGEVIGSLISRNRMVVRGRYRSDEAILAWSELGRTRGLFGSLGGLSGAPVLDKDGEIIGVVSAESPRRGRIYTVAPVYLRSLIAQSERLAEPLDLASYGLQADRLRRDRRVAQVICFVN